MSREQVSRLDLNPGLVVVHPHLGGVLPYVAERIGLLGGSKAKHPIEHYFKTNFYVDTAAGNPARSGSPSVPTGSTGSSSPPITRSTTCSRCASRSRTP